MLIPRLSFGKLVHISSSLMTLLLAMNIHTIAGHMKDDSAETAAQPLVSVAQAAAAENMPSVNDSSSKTKSDKDALEGWVSVLDANEAAEMSPDVGDAAGGGKKKVSVAADDCAKGISCAQVKTGTAGLGPDPDPEVSKAEADLVKDILARQSTIEGEQQQLDQQKHVLNAARAVLDQKMNTLDASMATLEQKQAAHREVMDAETDRLVKIYEDMPPKEAAAVFNIMDIHVLIAVASKMNTRKVSAIMGNMSPERVNLISQFMAGVRSFRAPSDGGDGGDRVAQNVGTATWWAKPSVTATPAAGNRAGGAQSSQ
jgi:flagellar motility protein MotE (MotC chaperone)